MTQTLLLALLSLLATASGGAPAAEARWLHNLTAWSREDVAAFVPPPPQAATIEASWHADDVANLAAALRALHAHGARRARHAQVVELVDRARLGQVEPCAAGEPVTVARVVGLQQLHALLGEVGRHHVLEAAATRRR